MHPNVKIIELHYKKLPETIEYYNKSKVRVDVLDQMARYNTCKSGSRRWSIAFFYNLLDFCAINAWVWYKETRNHNISRMKFLVQLIHQLCLDSKDIETEIKVDTHDQTIRRCTKRS